MIFTTIHTIFYKKLITQTMEVKKLIIFFSFSYYNFEDTVTYFDKDMFKKESFPCTNSNS